jgi:hypothetical protein
MFNYQKAGYMNDYELIASYKMRQMDISILKQMERNNMTLKIMLMISIPMDTFGWLDHILK